MSIAELKQNIVERTSPLVSVDELDQLIEVADVKIFDVRGTWKSPARALPDDYASGHIPSAVFLDWTKEFIDTKEEIGLASVANEAQAVASFKSLGINEGDLVVLYDNYHHMQAGRIWWAMRYWGFANVRVLNGGWDYWINSKLPVSTKVPEVGEGTFVPEKQANVRIDLEDFVANHSTHCLIDARGPISYAGTPEDPTTGHIPGALSIPFSMMIDESSGLFLTTNEMTSVLDERAPGWRDTPILTSCGSGYAATVILIALAELGHEGRLFDGSFSAWRKDPNRPIEQSNHN